MRARVLGQCAAGVLRLDRALFAHGRDNGYAIDAWLGYALRWADVLVHELAQPLVVGDLPLDGLIEDAAEAVADVVTALRRDRFGVPESLANALGALLVICAAATTSP